MNYHKLSQNFYHVLNSLSINIFNGNGESLASNSLFRMDDKNSNFGLQTVGLKCPLYSRMGHRVVRFSEETLIFGGTGPSGQFLKTVLRFNLENLKIEPISNTVCPSLEGFSLFTHNGTVYLWGGSLENKACNTLWCYQGGNFMDMKQLGRIPAPRTFHCSVYVANKYLLVYGGFNETEVFNDWWLLNLQTFTWNSVQCSIQLPKNHKFQLVWGNGRGFMLGEYMVAKDGSRTCLVPKNQLYQLRIVSFSTFKIRLDCFTDIGASLPSPRLHFSLLFFQRQLWVMGGEEPNQQKTEEISSFSNDIWAFNVETLQWSRKNLSLNTRYGFQLIGYKNRIFVIGGAKSPSEMSSGVDIINAKPISQYETQVCNFCRNVFSADPTCHSPKDPIAFHISVKDQQQPLTQISTNFLSKLARSLQNPIQALGLLLDNSLNMGASCISIRLHTPQLPHSYFKENQSYLYVGDNSRSFGVEEIERILFSFRFKVEKYYRDHIDKEDVKMRNQYGLNLKLASLRLGSSCLFVTLTVQGHIFVAYFSDSEIDCPDGDPSFNCFRYYMDKNGVCSNTLNRQIIRQNVRHVLNQNQYLECKTHCTKVYVLGIYDIVRSETRVSGNGSGVGNANRQDIAYLHSQGVILSSLFQYAACLYLSPFLGRQIYIEQNRVAYLNLASKFKQDQKNGLIQQIDTSMEVNIFVKISLYRILKSSYPTNFVYIYHENRLICAISSKERAICGFLEVPALIEVDFYRTKIQRWVEERKLIAFIESKEGPYKRQRKIENYLQQGHIHKLQPNYLQF